MFSASSFCILFFWYLWGKNAMRKFGSQNAMPVGNWKHTCLFFFLFAPFIFQSLCKFVSDSFVLDTDIQTAILEILSQASLNKHLSKTTICIQHTCPIRVAPSWGCCIVVLCTDHRYRGEIPDSLYPGGGYSTLRWVRRCGPKFRPPPYS